VKIEESGTEDYENKSRGSPAVEKDTENQDHQVFELWCSQEIDE
jgi:hypothetical protein